MLPLLPVKKSNLYLQQTWPTSALSPTFASGGEGLFLKNKQATTNKATNQTEKPQGEQQLTSDGQQRLEAAGCKSQCL